MKDFQNETIYNSIMQKTANKIPTSATKLTKKNENLNDYNTMDYLALK